MNYPLFALLIVVTTLGGIYLVTYLWDKCVTNGEGLQSNYSSDDEPEEEGTASNDATDDESADNESADEIEENVEQFIRESEDLFYQRLHDEVKVFRKLLEDRAAASAALATALQPEDTEPQQTQIHRRRRNRSF